MVEWRSSCTYSWRYVTEWSNPHPCRFTPGIYIYIMYPLNRRLGKHQSRSGHFVEERQFPAGFNSFCIVSAFCRWNVTQNCLWDFSSEENMLNPAFQNVTKFLQSFVMPHGPHVQCCGTSISESLLEFNGDHIHWVLKGSNDCQSLEAGIIYFSDSLPSAPLITPAHFATALAILSSSSSSLRYHCRSTFHFLNLHAF